MCKRFFERQKVDEIGFYSVKLQKVLIYLAVFNLLGLLAGLTNWFSALIEVILLYVAFHGSYKRKHGPLRAYVCINISFLILGVILGIAALMFYGSHVIPSDEIVTPMNDLKPVKNNTDMQDLHAPFMNIRPLNNDTNNDNQTHPIDIIPSSPSITHATGAYIALWFLVALSQILVFILKIVSIIMAARLARMIIAYNLVHLAHPSPVPSKIQTPPSPPTTPYIPMQQFPQNSNMYPQNSNMYPQPMYVPVVINGQPNGQPQQFIYPNPYFVPQSMYTPPQSMYTPMAPPQSNEKN